MTPLLGTTSVACGSLLCTIEQPVDAGPTGPPRQSSVRPGASRSLPRTTAPGSAAGMATAAGDAGSSALVSATAAEVTRTPTAAPAASSASVLERERAGGGAGDGSMTGSTVVSADPPTPGAGGGGGPRLARSTPASAAATWSIS